MANELGNEPPRRNQAPRLAAITLIAALASAGCGGTPTFCPGGFVRPAAGDAGAPSTCEGLCKPSLCKNPNNVCVDNRCELPCASHADCPIGQSCAAAIEDGTGDKITTCQSTGKGAIGTPCPNGDECAAVMTCGDGSVCPATGSCATGSCAALTCLSAGDGDAAAYCTLLDCHGDGDCPGGYWCKATRTADQICGAPSPPALCGSTMDPCVDPTKNAANGTTWAAGPTCTQRNECRVRGLCDPCASDLDCSLLPGGHCTNGGCATACAADADCDDGFQCTAGECVPRFGKCAAATGMGQLCQNCRVEADCGAGMFCGQIQVGGLHACLLAPLTVKCTADADCPASPGGLHAQCFTQDVINQEGGDPSTLHTCNYGPINTGLNFLLCWCRNQGASCLADSDCCSTKCTGGNAMTQTIGTCM